MRTALVQQTEPPDVMGIARYRIVLHTPGVPMAVISWRGAEDRIVRELQGAGYAVQTGRLAA